MCTVPALRSASGLAARWPSKPNTLSRALRAPLGEYGASSRYWWSGAVDRRGVGGARGAVHGQRKDAAILQLAHQRDAGAFIGGARREGAGGIHGSEQRIDARTLGDALAHLGKRTASSWMAPAQGCCLMSTRSASGSGTASSTSNILHMVATSASRSRADAFAASNGFVHASRLTRPPRFSRDLLCNKSGRFFTVRAQNRPRPHMPKHVKTGTVHLGIYGEARSRRWAGNAGRRPTRITKIATCAPSAAPPRRSDRRGCWRLP